jgi:site-specific DNA-cytosine methylase
LGAIAVVSAATFSLKLCGIQVETKFMSEVDDSKISMSKAMHARYGCSPQVHGDITLRNPMDMDQVDVFVSGAPCPAYSTAGLKKGIKDLRGCVILHSLKYVVLRRPAVVCLETSKA